MSDHNDAMPTSPGRPACREVSPSLPAELAWILDLLTQTAPYANPALAELDMSLLPGVKSLRPPVMERARRLWNDPLAGCPELILVADQADCLSHFDAAGLLGWLTTGSGGRPVTDYELLTEPAVDRAAIRARLRRLKDEVETRRSYRDLVAEVWKLVAPAWETRGRRAAVEACARWTSRLDEGLPIEDLMPPRHPLTYADRLDAAFVADRLRVLAEPTRVHILIQLLSAPAGVMDLARSLHMTQPTVSGHVKVLRDAGLVQARRAGSRTIFVGSRKRIERLLEDARATIARWD